MTEQQLAAVKQALEFVKANHSGGLDAFELITALQSIISQDALDKKAENARELGLDYEPAPVQEPVAWRVKVETKLRDGSVDVGYQLRNERLSAHDEPLYTTPPAQPAVQEGRDWSLLEATQESLREHMAEIKRLKAAQPAPVQSLQCAHCHVTIEALNDKAMHLIDENQRLRAELKFNTPPAPQPVPVKTYHDGNPWPVQQAPDPVPIIQQLVTALEGSGTRMRSDQWYVEIEAVAAGKFYLNSKGANHD